METPNPTDLFCVFCSTSLEPDAFYCAGCSEYKGVTEWRVIETEYPDLAKEIRGE